MAKKTIGTNPLDAYLSSITPAEEKKETPKKVAHKAPEEQIKKQRVTIHLPVDLINKVKDAVYWEPGLTLTSFAQQALQKALDKLEKKRGEKYPERKDHNLKGGRPLS